MERLVEFVGDGSPDGLFVFRLAGAQPLPSPPASHPNSESDMPRYSLKVNGRAERVECDPDTPLLWVLRDLLGLRGTKYGCGEGLCGICTVHLDGIAAPSCQRDVASVGDAAVTTIEGLAEGGPHPLIDAWVDEDVSQCGFCQPGQIMAAAALLASHSPPDEDALAQAMDRVLCRCGTYLRIRRAILRTAAVDNKTPGAPREVGS